MTEHETKYDDIAQRIGIETLKSIVLRIADKDTIISKLETDEHLNNIPLVRWDAWHLSVRNHAKQAGLNSSMGITAWSMSQTVCVLKHVAKHYIAEKPFSS